MSISSSVERARIAPCSARTAEKIASLPAIEAVCDCAAALPTALRPTFIRMTGFRARRASASASAKAGPSCTPST